MMKSHAAHVLKQFGPQSTAYVESEVHAVGDDLDLIEAFARLVPPRRALDLGAGGGHVAYRLATVSDMTVACDLSEDMVAAVLETARSKGLINIEGEVAGAEELPFADESFDFIACRYTAHHWEDFEAGLRESYRVLKKGGTAIFVDPVAPENSALDMHLQTVELLRDPSHIRNYRQSEWLAALGRAGYSVQSTQTFRIRMDFQTWTSRMNTSELHVAAIRSLQNSVSVGVAKHFEIEPDGSFMLDTILIEAKRNIPLEGR